MATEIRSDLKKIEKELTEIRNQSNVSWKRTIFIGILQGAGWLLGTIIAAALIGWILSILGIIPGFNEFESKLQNVIDGRSKY